MRHAALALLALALSLTAAPASAETVRLRDGSVFQGELVEKIPGDHVTIRLATGEVRQFAWGDIVHEGPLRRPPPPYGPWAPPLGERVHVTVRSDREGTMLFRVTSVGFYRGWRRRGFFETFEPVCQAPCDVDVDALGAYRIGGPGVRSSSVFGLPRDGGQVALDVSAGSANATAWGAAGIGVGLTAVIVGGIIALVGGTERPTDRGVETGGLVTMGVGAGLFALGLGVVIGNQTDVKTDRGLVLAKDTQPTPAVKWIGNGFAF